MQYDRVTVTKLWRVEASFSMDTSPETLESIANALECLDGDTKVTVHHSPAHVGIELTTMWETTAEIAAPTLEKLSSPESDRYEGPIETFFVADTSAEEWADLVASGVVTDTGWYWWSCSPGCLPDGDPSGPFASEEDAEADARTL